MVKSCCAYGCKNVWKPNQQIQYHTFPLNRPEMLNKWITAVRLEDFTPNPHTVICSQHFTEDSYSESCLSKKRLLKEAYPTIFSFPSYYKANEKKHRKLMREVEMDESKHCEDHLLSPADDPPIGRKRKRMAFGIIQENDQLQDSLHYDALMQDDEDSRQENRLLAPVNKSKDFITTDITIKEENIDYPEKSIDKPCQAFDSPVEGSRNGWVNDAVTNEDQSLNLLHNDSLATNDEEYMVVGRRIAFQLKALDEYQKIIAEKLMSDIIFYGKLGKLTESASVNCS